MDHTGTSEGPSNRKQLSKGSDTGGDPHGSQRSYRPQSNQAKILALASDIHEQTARTANVNPVLQRAAARKSQLQRTVEHKAASPLPHCWRDACPPGRGKSMVPSAEQQAVQQLPRLKGRNFIAYGLRLQPTTYGAVFFTWNWKSCLSIVMFLAGHIIQRMLAGCVTSIAVVCPSTF